MRIRRNNIEATRSKVFDAMDGVAHGSVISLSKAIPRSAIQTCSQITAHRLGLKASISQTPKRWIITFFIRQLGNPNRKKRIHFTPSFKFPAPGKRYYWNREKLPLKRLQIALNNFKEHSNLIPHVDESNPYLWIITLRQGN